MSLEIQVEAHSGYKANERPVRFWLDPLMEANRLSGVYEIEAVEKQWREPDAEYFQVRTEDGKRYVLRYDESEDEWTLRSGLDGAVLLERGGITFVTVAPEDVRRAELEIAGCERCRPKESEHLFDSIVAEVLNKPGAVEFVLTEPARCPNCREEIKEKTLVEAQGGVEVGAST